MAAWTLGYWLCVSGGVVVTALVAAAALSGRDDLRLYPVAVGGWILLVGAMATFFSTGLLKGVRVAHPGPGWFLSTPTIVGALVAFFGGHGLVALVAIRSWRRRPQRQPPVVHIGGLTEGQLATAEEYQRRWRAARRRPRRRGDQ